MSNLIQLFQDSSSLQGSNASFIEELYERFLEDPESVESSWQKKFKEIQQGASYETPHNLLLNLLEDWLSYRDLLKKV